MSRGRLASGAGDVRWDVVRLWWAGEPTDGVTSAGVRPSTAEQVADDRRRPVELARRSPGLARGSGG